MGNLVQVIYCSSAEHRFMKSELAELLRVARKNNAKAGITGMLLYADGSFFQVLEGEAEQIDRLLEIIRQDTRHRNIIIIIREPIAECAFGDWTMGYAALKSIEADAIIGANDFFSRGESFSDLGEGRAKKLLEAFKHGYWRKQISDMASPESPSRLIDAEPTFTRASADKPKVRDYSFAFQPIVNVKKGTVFSYEALLRGLDNRSAADVQNGISTSRLPAFDEESRLLAIQIAAHLGLTTHLNLNIIPSTVVDSPTAIRSVIEAAEHYQILPEQIVLEILESEMIADFSSFTTALRDYRASGLLFAIDDFGAGYAGLNLLAEFQPHLIKLDLQLVRDVESKGPRQAIIRGILRTCLELGIDIIAEGVETEAEYHWLRNEGIELFQGYLFARPAFEELSTSFHMPN